MLQASRRIALIHNTHHRAILPTTTLNHPNNHIQTRTFIDSFLNSALGPCPQRKLTHTKTLPYPAAAVFKAVSDVSGYPSFLPFTISSQVTARDDGGYPTRARLKVGYDKFGIEEDWDSIVRCDPNRGVVEAKSSDQASGGLFELLQTRWQINSGDKDERGESTSVTLNVDVKFRNSVYDQMFAQVEDKVAAAMITAFEARVRDMERQQ